MLDFSNIFKCRIKGKKKSRKSIAPLLKRHFQDSGKCILLLPQRLLFCFDVAITEDLKQVTHFVTDVPIEYAETFLCFHTQKQ